MSENKKIILIGGYARSGKSSSITILEQQGWKIISSSRMIHEFAQRLILMFTGRAIDTHDKEITFLDMLIRDFLIKLAEDVMMPVFTRAVFTAPMAALAANSPHDLIAIETYGGVEYDFLSKYLRLEGLTWQNYNIRRQTEEPGIDLRRLLPGGIDIENNSTFDDLARKLALLD